MQKTSFNKFTGKKEFAVEIDGLSDTISDHYASYHQELFCSVIDTGTYIQKEHT